MKGILFMTERLQIEGKLQVNLIPASNIIIHLDQTKLTARRGGKFCRLCGQHVYGGKNQKK